MDPDTWNSYHLMSNRARAVCFMARQQQFRAMSELTVNRLMQQAHEQTKFMDDLAVYFLCLISLRIENKYFLNISFLELFNTYHKALIF